MELEPEKGRPRFPSTPARGPGVLWSSKGKTLFIQRFRTSPFHHSSTFRKYLRNDPRFHGGSRTIRHPGEDEEHAAEGWPRRWDRRVQERSDKLRSLLGKEFGLQDRGHQPSWRRQLTLESGRLFPRALPPVLYRDASILANMAALEVRLPKSVTMLYANFMPGNGFPTTAVAIYAMYMSEPEKLKHGGAS